MRIAKLHMDPQDKTRFEIQGKSSVKYHLKANHVVEAKRWFWALNNAIQWTKDEAREENRKKTQEAEILRQARLEQIERQHRHTEASSDAASFGSDKPSSKGLVLSTAVGVPTTSGSRVSIQDSSYGLGSAVGDDEGSAYGSLEPSIAGNDMARIVSRAGTATVEGDLDDDEEYGDDASVQEDQPTSKDAFNITAQSAKLQLDLLAQVSSALQIEKSKNPALEISDPKVVQATSAYESAVRSLRDLLRDLLKISRDRDAYWQYRLDREINVRKLWENSMAHVAREQEELENRIGESEDKRKRTKKALRQALEGPSAVSSRPASRAMSQSHDQISEALGNVQVSTDGKASLRRKSSGFREIGRRKSTLAELANISDSESEDDEEFFDAVDAGEVEVVTQLPAIVSEAPPPAKGQEEPSEDLREARKSHIAVSFKGYEDPPRKRLKMDADDRPKISLWVNLSHRQNAKRQC